MNDSSENSAVDNSCRSWHHIADTVPAGNVIGYSGNIKEGDKQEYGSVVTINVSLGKKPEKATEQSFTYVDETRPIQ